MKLLILVVFTGCLLGSQPVFSQACEQQGSVEIRLQDENERPVRNASIRFVDVPVGNDGGTFTEYVHSYGSEYVGKYCESEIVGTAKQNRFWKEYDVLVKGEGFRERRTSVRIYHCLGSCLANRSFVTVVSWSAKMVTIKGKVKLESARFDGRGKLVKSERKVAGAPITFRRSTMVEFFTTSDAQGNYELSVPAGAYRVYASAAGNCVLCAEYFGNVVGSDDPTNLNITLRFYGEG